MMKRNGWRFTVAAGLFALCLCSCQGNSAGKEETVTAAMTQQEDEPRGEGEEKQKAEEPKTGESEALDTEAAEESAADAEEIKSSNPMQEVSGPEALAEIGVSMGTPETAELGPCFIISQVVAEVNFTFEENPYTYRGSATAEDFSGIFEEFEEEVTSVAATDEMPVEKELTIKTTKSGGKLAAWSRNDANYTLYTPAAVDTEELLSLCQELIEKN